MKTAISVEQVANGYLIEIVNQKTWDTKKTVHFSPEDAMARLQEIFTDVKATALAITAGPVTTPDQENVF